MDALNELLELSTKEQDVPALLLAAYSLGRVTEKSVNEVVRDYDSSLRRLVIATVNGDMTGTEMARAHRVLLRRIDTEAYYEGMREGGVSDPASNLTELDEQDIGQWLVGELDSAPSLARDCDSASELTGTARRQARTTLLERVALWTDNVRALAMLGFASAKKNMMVTFQLGGTKDHCKTCSSLNGKRHRLSWFQERNLIPRQRGNAHFDCGGWRCKCDLLDDRGRSVMV